jgi:hypothetical protein
VTPPPTAVTGQEVFNNAPVRAGEGESSKLLRRTPTLVCAGSDRVVASLEPIDVQRDPVTGDGVFQPEQFLGLHPAQPKELAKGALTAARSGTDFRVWELPKLSVHDPRRSLSHQETAVPFDHEGDDVLGRRSGSLGLCCVRDRLTGTVHPACPGR